MHRLRNLLFVALACAVFAACAVPGRATSSSNSRGDASRVGLNGVELASYAEMSREVNAIAATGATWVRADFNWPTIEPSRGVYNWAPADQLVSLLASRHLRALGLLTYAPHWAGTTPNPLYYAEFAGKVARRYAAVGVHDWEIWNEANLNGPWPGAPNPVAYTRLLRAAYGAIHASDRYAVVVSSGLSPAADQGGYSYRPYSFIRAMYAAGAKGAFDAIGLHLTATPNAATINQTWNPPYSASVEIYPLMRAMGDGAKHIWATEAGYSTTADGSHGVSERAQSMMTIQLIQVWLAKPFAGPVFIYTLRDPGTDRWNWFDNMGLLRRDWSAKPAFSGLASWLR